MTSQQVSGSNSRTKKLFYGYIIVAAALLIVILTFGSRFSFGVFFKPMLGEVDWSRTLTSGAVALSMLFQGVGSIYMGRLTDRLGPRFVMTVCGLLLGAGLLLMSLVNHVWQLYVFYGVIVGAGMGGAFVAPLSTVARWFVKRRGVMTGIVIAGIGLGTLIVPPLAYWLISIYDWRMSYAIVGSCILVIGVLAAQVMRRDPHKMGLKPYGGDEAGERRFAASEGVIFGEAIRTSRFWLTAIAYLCLGYSLYSINIHLVPSITDLGISAATGASVLAIVGAFFAVGCIVLGGAVDRIGSKLVFIICFILIVASVLALSMVREVWMLYLFAMVYGLGSGGGAPVMSTLTAELFGMKSHGAIFGVLSFCFAIGGAIGPFLTGYLFDVTGNYQLAFLVCAGSGAIGLVFSSVLRQMKKQAVPELET